MGKAFISIFMFILLNAKNLFVPKDYKEVESALVEILAIPLC
jgi:hypothetical protein